MDDVAKGSIDGYLFSMIVDGAKDQGKKTICKIRIRLKIKKLLAANRYPGSLDSRYFPALVAYIKDNLLKEIISSFKMEDIEKRRAAEKVIIDCAITHYQDISKSKNREDAVVIEQFVRDCINIAHECIRSTLSSEQEILLSENQEATYKNREYYDKAKETKKHNEIKERMEKKLKKAWNREISDSPSLKRIRFSEEIAPKGTSEIIHLTVSNSDCWDKNERSLQEVIDITRNKKTYNSIFLYGNGGIGKTVALLKLKADAYKIYIPLRFVHKGIKDYILNSTFESDEDLLEEFLLFCRKNEKPPILMLDGLNEMEQKERKALKDEINTEFRGFNIQFIISARYDASKDFQISNMLRLSCIELSEELVSKYLHKFNIPIPEKGSRIYKIINTPFMLMLYACVESQNRTSGINSVEIINPGSIIWNYLLREQERMKENDSNSGLASVVLFYVAPFIAYSMINRSPMTFSIPKKEYYKLIDDACSEFENDRDNHCLRGNLESTLPDCSFEYDKNLIFDILFKKLCVCVNSGDEIQFSHQHFRDSLAALYIYQRSINNVNVIFEYLSKNTDQYIIDFLVDYFQLFDEIMGLSTWNTFWETCRLGNKNSRLFINNMLEIYKRIWGNDISSIDFSGLDLTLISLCGYKLANSKNHFNDTVIDRSVFVGRGHSMSICALSWCSDSLGFYSASYDMTIRLWGSMDGGSEAIGGLSSYVGHYIRCAKISPVNDRIIAYGGDDKKLFLNTLTDSVWNSKVLSESDDWIYSISWDKHGESIVYGDRSGAIKQVFVNSSTEYEYKYHKKSVRCIDFSQNNMIVSGGDDGLVCVWEQSNNVPKLCLDFGEIIMAVHWLNDMNHIAVAFSNVVYLIDCNIVGTNIVINSNQIINGMQKIEINGIIRNVAFQYNKESDYCAIFTSDKIYIKQLYQTGESFQIIDIASRDIDTNETGIVFCSEWDHKCEKLVFGSRNGSVWLGHLYVNEEVFDRFEINKVSSGSLSTARCSDWNSNGDFFASGYDDGTIRIRGTNNYHCVKVLEGHLDSVKCLSWSPVTGDKIASGSDDGSIKLWSLNDGSCKSFRIFSPVNCVLWFSENLIVGGTDSGEVVFINPNDETIFRERGGHTNRIYNITPTPKGDGFISAGDDKMLCLWKSDEFNNYKCYQTLNSTHISSIRSLTTCNTPIRCGIYSAGNDGEIYFHEIDAISSELRDVPDSLQHYHDDFIYSIAISKNQDYLLSGSTDSSLGFWEISSHKWTYSIYAHGGFVWHVSVSPKIGNKYYFSSSSSDGTVRIWSFPEIEELEWFCEQGPTFNGTTKNLGVNRNSDFTLLVLPGVNVVGCDFTKAIISDDWLKQLLNEEGGIC